MLSPERMAADGITVRKGFAGGRSTAQQVAGEEEGGWMRSEMRRNPDAEAAGGRSPLDRRAASRSEGAVAGGGSVAGERWSTG